MHAFSHYFDTCDRIEYSKDAVLTTPKQRWGYAYDCILGVSAKTGCVS